MAGFFSIPLPLKEEGAKWLKRGDVPGLCRVCAGSFMRKLLMINNVPVCRVFTPPAAASAGGSARRRRRKAAGSHPLDGPVLPGPAKNGFAPHRFVRLNFVVTMRRRCLYCTVHGRPYRLAVRTLPFHGGSRGSIPLRVARLIPKHLQSLENDLTNHSH